MPAFDLLGWIVIHTGSIIPAMLMHAAYDITSLLLVGLPLHWGREPGDRAAVWVLPNTSGLNANHQLPDLARLFGELRAWVQEEGPRPA